MKTMCTECQTHYHLFIATLTKIQFQRHKKTREDCPNFPQIFSKSVLLSKLSKALQLWVTKFKSFLSCFGVSPFHKIIHFLLRKQPKSWHPLGGSQFSLDQDVNMYWFWVFGRLKAREITATKMITRCCDGHQMHWHTVIGSIKA